MMTRLWITSELSKATGRERRWREGERLKLCAKMELIG